MLCGGYSVATSTAELAACLPVLLVVVAVAISAVSVAGDRVRAQDPAREAVRAAARGDLATAQRLASDAAPGAAVAVTRRGDLVIADVRLTVQPLGHLENAEGKRRIRNLIEVSGLIDHLVLLKPRAATEDEVLRLHTRQYVDRIKDESSKMGGDAGELTPFGPGS